MGRSELAEGDHFSALQVVAEVPAVAQARMTSVPRMRPRLGVEEADAGDHNAEVITTDLHVG